jgi:hypothetical protein
MAQSPLDHGKRFLLHTHTNGQTDGKLIFRVRYGKVGNVSQTETSDHSV